MSGLEITVVLFGLFLGYWLVSKFIGGARVNVHRYPDTKEASFAGNESTLDGERDNSEPSCYQVLGITPNASSDEIRRAYRVLIDQYHPDKVATLGEELRSLAERKTKEFNSAYREALRLRGEEA